ncbi:MAG: siphovirus Gp157 family protein, partial [Microcystaceae cyanobacterium]
PSDKALAQEIFDHFLPRLEKKIDAYANAIRRLKARRDFRRVEAKRLTALANSDEASLNWLTDKLVNFMERRVEQLGERGKKLEGLYCRISLCHNGGQPSVWINPSLDVTDFPPDYIVQIPTVNSDKLKADVLAKGELKDSTGKLLAKVLPKGKHVRLT